VGNGALLQFVIKKTGRLHHGGGEGAEKLVIRDIIFEQTLCELGGREKKSPRPHREVVYRRKSEF
jgi:hypothetical protein